ncbi:MAG: hypothetical protein NXH82_13295 [Rhodobacteraceae bacterium]|nr:hypothetical protein [Paracoccaceae bacterium]
MLLRCLLILVLLAGCARPLTETERAFAARVHGPTLDLDRVRLGNGTLAGSVTYQRKARPRVTCRERIFPPPTDALVTVRPAAVALFNRVNFSRGWYLENYQPDYPERLYLVEAMLLAHELTHVWQWQNRARTGYHPLRAAAEHRPGTDPYLFELDDRAAFLDFGFEQQGGIVEEYVCCRAIAPDAARTRRLHDMLAEVFDPAALPGRREHAVILPWNEADLRGICD